MNEEKKEHLPKRVHVTIYCKIYAEQYATLEGACTGDEIYEHLMKDANCCVDEDMNTTPGDKNIWYLCTNEKHGYLFLETNESPIEWKWSVGESSYKIVKDFVNKLFSSGILTESQYKTLLQEILIAKTLGDMYQIPAYLEKIKNGERWIPRITPTKTQMKIFHQNVKGHFEEKGFKVE